MQSLDLLVPKTDRVCAIVWQHLVRAKIARNTPVHTRVCWSVWGRGLGLVWEYTELQYAFYAYVISNHHLRSLWSPTLTKFPFTSGPSLKRLIPPRSLREAIYLNYTLHCAPNLQQGLSLFSFPLRDSQIILLSVRPTVIEVEKGKEWRRGGWKGLFSPTFQKWWHDCFCLIMHYCPPVPQINRLVCLPLHLRFSLPPRPR